MYTEPSATGEQPFLFSNSYEVMVIEMWSGVGTGSDCTDIQGIPASVIKMIYHNLRHER